MFLKFFDPYCSDVRKRATYMEKEHLNMEEMETSEKVIAKLPGIITLVCAAAMVLFHALQGHGMDAYILPFILIMCGINILLRKPEEERKKVKMGKSSRRITIAALSISLVAGIVVMLLTLV